MSNPSNQLVRACILPARNYRLWWLLAILLGSAAVPVWLITFGEPADLETPAQLASISEELSQLEAGAPVPCPCEDRRCVSDLSDDYDEIPLADPVRKLRTLKAIDTCREQFDDPYLGLGSPSCLDLAAAYRPGTKAMLCLL